MKDDFDDVSEGLAPTLATLAEDYGLPDLAGMYGQRLEMFTLLSLEGVSVPAIDVNDRNCSIIFSYRDDIEVEYGVAEGFEIVLVDDESGESLVSVYHAMTDPESGRFDVSGGHINADLGADLGENDSGIDPWMIMGALLEAEPDDDFPVPVQRGPYLH